MMMLDSESLAQSALNGYSIYKTGSCKKAFFQGITKTKEITSVSNVKCFKPIFDESLRNPTVISFINGQQIKDLHLVTKKNSLKINPVKISNNSSPTSDQSDMRKPITGDVNIPCKCPKEPQKLKTKQTNGIAEKKQKKVNGLPEKQPTNKNLDHNFRKRCDALNSREHINEEPKEYVYKSSQRIQMLVNRNGPSTQINNQLLEKMLGSPDQLIEIEKKHSSQYSKKTRCSAKDNQTKINSNETKNSRESEVTNSTLLTRCEWFDCTDSYKSVEELTNHVKLSHMEKLMNNDQFVCLWRDCKFSNQPSCSFKWLSKHVMRHCDLKPFKCVILGCDMTFSTQNGLARHVPTHFNESRVRRACVLTSETVKKEDIRPRRSLSTTLSSCSESSSIFSDTNKLDKEEEEEKKESNNDGFTSVVRNLNVEKSRYAFTPKTYAYVKSKIQNGSLNPSTNSGYSNGVFRIDHKVIGRRTTRNGSTDMLMTPSLHNIFPNSSLWCDGAEFRKRKHSYVELPMSRMPTESKNRLYDLEHCSTVRRSKKRK